MPASKEIVLRNLRLSDEILDRREACANLKGSCGTLGDFDIYDNKLIARAALGRDINLLKEAQSRDAFLGNLEIGLIVELTL